MEIKTIACIASVLLLAAPAQGQGDNESSRATLKGLSSISVSVIANSAEQGVVLAKAIFMMGPAKGLLLARSEGVEALVIDPAQKRYTTEGFARLLESN